MISLQRVALVVSPLLHALWWSSAGRHFATKEMTGGMLDLHMTSGNEKFFIYAHFSLAHVL